MEARGGIEPPMKVLQTFALPLGYRAVQHPNDSTGDVCVASAERSRFHFYEEMSGVCAPLVIPIKWVLDLPDNLREWRKKITE